MQIIAYISMFIDHIAKSFGYSPLLGRLAMPIFAYLVAKGMKRTKNKYKYILRMCIFAIISQIPFVLMVRNGVNPKLFNANIPDMEKVLKVFNHYTFAFNIGFTFLISLLTIYFIDKNKDNFINKTIILIISLFATVELNVDYGIYGVLTVLIFYYIENKGAIVFLYLLVTSYQVFKNSFTPNYNLVDGYLENLKYYFSAFSLPIIFYMKENKQLEITKSPKLQEQIDVDEEMQKRDKSNIKYLKYLIYPLHMLLIYIIRVI